ncbi:MAG: TonB-dependent receptor domain-containing protein [Janthinobacterium lividum]
MMQTNKARSLALACVLSAAAALSAHAQSTTQGAIAGTVFDASGAAVPNATVVIHDEATNAEITLKSSDSGEFRAPQLTPGSYTVTINATGFTAAKTTQIVVQVNQVTELNPHLQTGSESTVVEVTADIPAINFDSPTFGGSLSNREIENIPINNRRWSSLALTTPGVTNDASGFGLLSFRSISAVLNNVQIDGADDNQAFFGEERGRTRAGYSTSQAMVREFQVNTGVYSAEFGRAVGGVINSVTKTGSNSLHGEAYFYRRDDQTSAYNPYTSLGQFNSAGQFFQTPFRPKDKRNQYGFEVGGPIVKDKLFFVYAFDVFDRQFPGVGRASAPGTFFATANGSFSTGYTCNTATGQLTKTTTSAPTVTQSVPNVGACLLAARTGTSVAGGVTAYNNGLQTLNSALGTTARYGHQNINTPKLTWNITPKHTVNVLYHRMRWDSPGGVQTQSSVSYATDSFGTDFVKLDYGLIRLNSLLTSRIANEVRYQYGRELNNEGQQPYNDFTKNNLLNPTTGNVSAYSIFSSAGFSAGQQTYSNRLAYPDERKWQVSDTLSLSLGKHNVRAGFDIVHNNDVQNQLFQAQGSFTYSTSIANFLSDLAKPNGTCNTALTGVGTLPCYNSYTQGTGPSAFTLNTTDMGFFVQDDYKLAPRFTLNLGVRYDYEKLPAPYANLTTIAQTTNAPSDKNNFSPRVGFAWDPYGQGKMVVRGGYGLYYGRIPNSVLLNVFQNTGSAASQTSVTFTPGSAGQPTIRNQANLSAGVAPASIYYFDKHFQNPYTQQFDFAVQQDLGKSNVLSVQYLGALGRELPNYINTNLDPANAYNVTYNIVPNAAGSCGPVACGQITNRVYGGRRQTNATGTLSNTYNGVAVTPNTTYAGITDVISNINSSYHAMSVDVTNRAFRWVTFDANYTWAHALDFSQLQTTGTTINNWIDPFGNQRANYGNSNLDTRHRAVGWAILNIPGVAAKDSLASYFANGWSIKPLVAIQSGLPYSATVSGSTPQQCNAAGCLAASTATSSGLQGTSISYIPQLGRNTFQFPRTINVDTRVQKDFRIHENYTLQVIAEAFNLANHQNVTTINSGAYTLASANNANPALAPTATLTPVTSFGTVSATNSTYAFAPRQFQFALRLQF